MVVSTVQFKTGDTEHIREKGLSLIREALKDKPDFILLQEFFPTIYFPQYKKEEFFGLAEEIPGKTTESIYKVIKGSNTTVIAPVFERAGNNYFCSAAVIHARDGIIGTYRKLHIPSVEGIHETYYFKYGDTGHKIIQTEKSKIAIMLCYDRHFPESARLYGLGGVDILFIAAATPKGARNIWSAEMRAHAFSNVFYLVCANRAGTEDKIEFLGRSFICDYRGNVLAEAGEDADEIVTADINIDEALEARRQSAFYRDRRPELYGGLA